MYRIILLVISGFFLVTSTFGQKVVVRGKILDSVNKEPIIGANIYEQDNQGRIITGTITDLNGNFQISASGPNAVLKFRYIGYKPSEQSLGNRTEIEVLLEAENIVLSEVVVTAEKKAFDPLSNIAERDRTGSAVKIDMKEMLESGITSAEDALQGQISGVDILSSGTPGAGGSIVIRGLSTLGNANPLIVVDGIPQDIKPSEGFDFASADTEDIGDLVNIAPQDIKSIQVLKDAASTAVWGSKGANGVILIETHRGRLGKTVFTYQSKVTAVIPPKPIPMLNGDEYVMMQLEELHAPTGIFTLPRELSGDPSILGKDFYNYSANTDWVQAITKNDLVQDHYLKMTGGGERTNFFTSLNYYDEQGTTVNTSLKRLSSRINLDYKVSNRLSFQSNFSYTNSYKEDNYNPGFNIREMAYLKASNMSIWEYDSEGNKTGNYFNPIQSYQGAGDRYYNPVAMGALSMNDMEQNQVQTTFALDYKVIKGIDFKQTINYTYLNSKSNRFLPSGAIGADWLDRDNNRAYELNQSVNSLLTRSQLFLSPRIADNHTLSGVLMWETNSVNSNYISLGSEKTASSLITDPATSSTFWSNNSGASELHSLSGLAQLFYKYRDKYLLTMNVRTDGNSKFGSGNRWGVFPSISLAWRFSSEPFLEDYKLGDSKLRVSYGVTGNDRGSQLGPYDRHAIYGTNTSTPNQYIQNPLILPLQVQLDQLKWETVSQLNIGLDLDLFNRLNTTFEVYDKITSNILWNKYVIPSSSGLANLLWYNGGEIKNTGWDLMFNYQAVKRENFNLRLNLNLSHNTNRYMQFPTNFNNEVSTALGDGEYPRRAVIGDPIGSFYGLVFKGVYKDDASVVAMDENGNVIYDVKGNPLPVVFQNTYQFKGGDAIYEDINRDGVIDLLDVVYLGDSNPALEGGFGFTMVFFKNFTVSAQFHSRYGYEIVNGVAITTQGMNNRNNQSKAVLRRWRKPGDEAPDLLPRAYMAHPANNLGSDRYVEDGSFIRLNNLLVKYAIPKNFSQKYGIAKMEAALTMRKVWTLTRYSGLDPEIPRGSDPFWVGIDDAKTPPPQRITLSLMIDF